MTGGRSTLSPYVSPFMNKVKADRMGRAMSDSDFTGRSYSHELPEYDMLPTGKILVSRNKDPLEYSGGKFSLEKCAQIFTARCPAKRLEARFASGTNALLASHDSLETQGRWQQPRCGLDGVKCDRSP